jgi:hypothetical protein
VAEIELRDARASRETVLKVNARIGPSVSVQKVSPKAPIKARAPKFKKWQWQLLCLKNLPIRNASQPERADLR